MGANQEILETDEELEAGQQVDEGSQEQPVDEGGQEQHVSREDIRSDVLNEGIEDAVVEELGAKEGEITIDDLRKLPGSEEYTDEQLMAEWNKAVQATAQGGTQQQGTEQKVELPFPVYDDKGNKVDPAKLTLTDLLSGKVQIGYQALGKEQRKALGDVIRNASLGHWNEQKYQTTLAERNRVAQELATIQTQAKQFEQERATWNAALTALVSGDIKPLQQLAQAYQQALRQAPPVPGTLTADQVAQQRAQDAAGFQAINRYIIPKGIEIAQRYGATPQEVLAAIQWYIEHEPAQFFSKEKLDSILTYEVPMLLENNGYKATAPAASQEQQTPKNEVEELKQQIAALQATIAGQKNTQTEGVRTRQKKVPPVGGGSIPSAGDSMPNFKNRAQFKAWSQNDPDWAKY